MNPLADGKRTRRSIRMGIPQKLPIARSLFPRTFVALRLATVGCWAKQWAHSPRLSRPPGLGGSTRGTFAP